MVDRKSLLPVIIAVICVNGAGVLLKILDYPGFIILLGFRFHISMVLPFLFIINRIGTENILKEFRDPEFKRNYPYVISVFLLPVILFAVMYYLQYLDLGDPEYFYEFGLSSVLDLPIYLIWNAPQLIMFYLFLLYTSGTRKFRIPAVFLASVLPFAFEFYPWNNVIPLNEITVILIASVITTIIVLKLRNIYWFTIFIYLFLWQYILMYGSGSPVLVKIIFAAQYRTWEGFFALNKNIQQYGLLVYVISVTFTLIIFSLFIKKEKTIS